MAWMNFKKINEARKNKVNSSKTNLRKCMSCNLLLEFRALPT